MTKLKKLFISMLAVIALVCTMVSFTVFAATGTATLKEPSQSDVTTDGWTYGETVTLPTGTLSLEGEEDQKATVSVVYPDGKIASSKELVLDVEGYYTVKYEATFSGEAHVVEEYVKVEKDLFHVTSSASKVEYITYNYKDRVTNEHISANKTMVESSVTGLQVSIAPGDEFQFSRAIDVSKLTKDDDLIKMVLAPNQIGVKDVNEFYIVLTDAYDPDNFITIKYHNAGVTPLCYALVNANNGQQPTGWEFNRDVKHVGSAGTPLRFSFTGPCQATESTTLATTSASHNDSKFGITTLDKNDFAVSYDAATKQIHDTASAHASATTMLVDLDDPTHFEKVWKGFTTGECFLSIRANGYLTESFNFMITEVYGVPYLKRYDFSDRGTLDIDVDTGKYDEENLPMGKVGVEYPIFTASTVNQYYGKLNASYVITKDGEVVVENGEKFVPTEAGDYKLVYTVYDYLYNKNAVTDAEIAENEKHKNDKVLDIKVVDDFDPIGFDLANKVETGVAGQVIEIADVINTVGGGCPEVLTITKAVKFGEQDVVIKNDTFFPTTAGTYTVAITATDYVGENATVYYDVVIGTGDKPVYVDSPDLPRYFVSGQSYVLPEVVAYDYTDGSGREVATKIAYIDGEGVKNANGRQITPVTNQNKSTVDIIYYTSSYTAEGNLVKNDIPVIDIMSEGSSNLINFKKLFVPYGVEIGPDKDNKNLVLKANEADGYADMVNPFGANSVSIRFQAVQGKTSFKAFSITLTDSLYANEQIKLLYIPYDNVSSKFRINDFKGSEFTVNQSLINSSTFLVEMSLDDNGVKFDSTNSALAPIETYVDGEEFKGFTSGRVYVTLGFIEATEAEVAVINVAGQRIYVNPTADRIKPMIAFEGEYLGYAKYGSEFRIPVAVVSDAIDPAVVGSVTVELPADANGKRKIAASTDGAYLKDADISREYFVKADTYGSYRVSFKSVDKFGNTLQETYIVNVVDTTAPIITIPTDATKTGKVNEKITLKTATAVDNVDGNVNTIIYVYSPASAIYELKPNQTSFKTNAAGVYRIMYVSRDAAGNIGIATYKLTVTA